MIEEIKANVVGEHALREEESDRLGFAEVAGRIANSLVDRASIEGLVVGLDGRWGSGKSSLLHLIERALAKLPTEQRPTIINFRPWLIGDRDALLTALFGELADKIARVTFARGDASAITIQKAQKTAKAVRRFGRALGNLGDLVEAAEVVLPAAGILGRLLKGARTAAEKEPEVDLAALKGEIIADLRDLNHRFVITVDDVDRLEPAEAVEVLRLVRSVADFPNIIYLLCYDADRLAEAIETGASVTGGAAYLEKIIQLTVMIPTPEPFELREWFAEELGKVVGSVTDYAANERLKTVIDQEGGLQLRTPRSVVRTIDSIRFFWPAMRDEAVDIGDLVWLQLIKDGSPRLYRWIETYVASAAATSFGTTMVTEVSVSERLKALTDIIGENQFSDLMYRHMLSEILPGVEISFSEDGPLLKIHQKVGALDRKIAIDGRRLASPDHYRLYFSLVGPTHAITQAGFDSFWLATQTGPDETANVLLELNGQRALGSLRKSDVLFERLRSVSAARWNPITAKNLVLALGRMMDDAYLQNPREGGFIVTSWDRAERLVPITYANLSGDERAAVNEELFSSGPALGWLTAVLRSEIFAHGVYGDQKKPSSEWLLPAAEFTRACEIMVGRYRTMSAVEILATPQAAHIFYAWKQAGDEEGPRAVLAAAAGTDEGLVEVLQAFTNSSSSSDRGRFTVLKRENIEHFIDYNDVVERLKTIATTGHAEIAEKARQLLAIIEASRDF